ncbi:hypothetical protein ACJO1Z_08940 [Vibrio parahaemolyticus]|uniref:hypothetical protein n=1 Tax=Vibrio parahaemolyticus TaxID=670 RepID=UPI00387B634D
MSFYIVLFISIGFGIGLLTGERQKNNVLAAYVIISVLWFFAWGPAYAILTFLELFAGDRISRALKAPFVSSKPSKVEALVVEAKISNTTNQPHPIDSDNENSTRLVAEEFTHSDSIHVLEFEEIQTSITNLIEKKRMCLRIFNNIPANLSMSRKAFDVLIATLSMQIEACEFSVLLSKHDVCRSIPTNGCLDFIRDINSESGGMNNSIREMFDDPVDALLGHISLTERLDIYREVKGKDIITIYNHCFRKYGIQIEIGLKGEIDTLKDSIKALLNLMSRGLVDYKGSFGMLNDVELNKQFNKLELSLNQTALKLDRVLNTPTEQVCSSKIESRKKSLSQLDKKISDRFEDKPAVSDSSDNIQVHYTKDTPILEVYDNFTQANRAAKKYSSAGVFVKVIVAGDYSIVSSNKFNFSFTPALAEYFHQMKVKGMNTKEIAISGNIKLSSSIDKAVLLIKGGVLALKDVNHDFQLDRADQELVKREFEKQIRALEPIRRRPVYERFEFTMKNLNYNELNLLAAEVQRVEMG